MRIWAFCEIAKDAATIQQPTTATMRVIIILSQTMVNVYDRVTAVMLTAKPMSLAFRRRATAPSYGQLIDLLAEGARRAGSDRTSRALAD
jgi:hypothetical protein